MFDLGQRSRSVAEVFLPCELGQTCRDLNHMEV